MSDNGERESFTPATNSSTVVVIGAGPAGLEAARVAALRGHRVTLLEARDQLGGSLELWSRLPGRDFYRHAVDWWERELSRLGATVRKGEAVTAEQVRALSPDAVVVATGARFSSGGRSGLVDRDILGAEKPHVFTPDDILLGGVRPTGKVVVLDGEGTQASSGTAELVARADARVTMVSSSFAPYSNRVMFAFEGEAIASRMADANIDFRGATWVRSIGDSELLLYDVNSGRETTMAGVDAVILATGRVPVHELGRALEGKVAQLFTIGDALCVRPFATAAFEGQKFARLIGEPGAARTISEAYFTADDPAVYPVPAGA